MHLSNRECYSSLAITCLCLSSQRLCILIDGALVDATVERAPSEPGRPMRHCVRIANHSESQSIDLNRMNHSKQYIASVKEYQQEISSWCDDMVQEHRTLKDGITGLDLNTGTTDTSPIVSCREMIFDAWLSARLPPSECRAYNAVTNTHSFTHSSLIRSQRIN